MKPSRSLHLATLAFAVLAIAPTLQSASTSWVAVPTDATWLTGINWAAGTAPGTTTIVNNATRNGDIATFNQPIDASGFGGSASPVTTDTNRFLLGLTFGAGAGSYVIGSSSGSLLQLDRAGKLLVEAGVTNPQVIANPIQVRQASSNNATYTFQNDSTTPSATLSLTVPAFTLTSVNGRPTTLTLTGSNTGNNTISSNITDAMGGQNVGIITKTGTGRWVLSGANVFTIGTGSPTNQGFQVNGGTLSIQNNLALGSAASGLNGNQTSVNNGGTLELANGITLLDGIIINLNNGGTLATSGSTTSNATVRLPLATSGVSATIGSTAPGDVLTLGNLGNDLTGGMADTILNISGPGTVSLPQGSNYIGSWSINSGTLLLGNDNSLGTAAVGLGFGAASTGTLSLNGLSATVASLNTNASVGTPSVLNGAATNATLTVNGSGSFGGSLSDGVGGGTLALAKSGAGILTLSGASTLTGGTAVNAGSLFVTGSLPGSVSVATGAILGGSGTLSGAVSLATGATVSPGQGTGSVATLAAGSLTLAAGSAFTAEFATPSSHDKVNVTGSNGLTLNGGGVTLLNAATQLGFTTTGTYELIQYSGTLGGSGTGALSVLNPQAGKTYAFGATATAITLAIGDAPVNANWIADANGSWADDANWQDGLVPNGIGEAANLTQTLTAPRTVTLDGDVVVGGVTLAGETNAYTITQGSSGTLTFDNGGSQANLIVLSGAQTVSAPVALTSNTITSLVGSSSLQLSGAVSGPGSLTKSGVGSLTLSGINTYAGGTSVTGGTLAFSSLANLGTGNLAFDGASLFFNTGNTTDITARTVTVGTGGLTLETNGNDLVFFNSLGNNGLGGLVKNGSGILTLNGVNTYGGATTLNAGSLIINSNDSLGLPAAAAGLTLGADTTLASTATLDLTNRPLATGAAAVTFNPAADTTLTVSGSLSGSGNVAVLGGTLALNGNNSLTRTGSYLLVGTLALGGGQANGQLGLGNGAGTITFQGGTLAMNGSAGDNANGFGALANPLFVGSSETGTLKATYRGAISGPLTGEGTLNLVIPATRTDLAGNWSAFTGTVNVAPATAGFKDLRFTNNALFTNTRLHLAADIFAYQTFNPPNGGETVQTIGQLSGDAGSVLSGNPVAGRYVNWTIGGLNTSSTFAGVIQDTPATGSGNLGSPGQARVTKNGTGTLTLTGNCTYTSTTTVNGGVLQVGAGGTTGALGMGDIVINSELVFDRSDALTQANLISGAGSLTKNGAGTLILTGASTHTGATTVNVGSLLVEGSLASATVGVGSGATLGGTGTLTGAASLLSGSILSPGSATNAVESLGLGSATIAGAVRIEYDADLPAGTDSLNVTGALDLTGATLDLVNVSPTTEPLGAPAYIIATYGTLNGAFASVTGLPSGYTLSFAYNDGVASNHIALVSAPTGPIATWADAYGLAGGAANAAADPDGDGFNNLAEFAFNSVPNQSGPNPAIVDAVQNVAGQPTLTYTIPVRTAATTVAVANGLGFQGDGIRYNIQGGTIIGAWTHAVTEVVPTLDAGLPVLETGWSYRTFSLGDNVTNIPKGFIRVQVDTVP